MCGFEAFLKDSTVSVSTHGAERIWFLLSLCSVCLQGETGLCYDRVTAAGRVEAEFVVVAQRMRRSSRACGERPSYSAYYCNTYLHM